jgi:hypothetical protein
MHRFANTAELLTHARSHITNRVNSLESDASHCLLGDGNNSGGSSSIAPFPALLYCFATVDLLGALASGRADRHAPTTEQSIQYMTNFMCYSIENANILIGLFRHKLVHLAQPSPLIRYGSEVITWKYHHNDRWFHLRMLPHTQNAEIGDVPRDWHIPVTHEFHISIMDFVNEIKESTMKRPNGY